MKTVKMEINGRTVQAQEGMTLLEAAREAGIEIPTLCHNPQLKPSGHCRMCLVEVVKGKRTRLVASCCHPAQEGLVVTTNNEKLTKIRRLIIELLWPSWGQLAERYGVKQSRFTPGLRDCSLCGQCVRYCEEVAKKHVLYYEGRGIDRHIAFTPGMDECDSCRQCFELCNGGFVITEHGRAALEWS